MSYRALLAIGLVTIASPLAAQTPVSIPVTLEVPQNAPVSGRLLVFATKMADDKVPDEVDTNPFMPSSTAIVARDVSAFAKGATVSVDGETDSFPTPFSALTPGKYAVQVVLDRNGSYNYGGRGAGDLVSKVAIVNLPGAVPAIPLVDTVPETDVYAESLKRLDPKDRAAREAALKTSVKVLDFVSPALSRFYGRPVAIQGYVASPPAGARKNATYPVVYTDTGFGGTLEYQKIAAAKMAQQMASGEMPPMIWVFLNHGTARGTHEFADSVNTGPWGTALTREVVPWIDRNYPSDGKAASRFLTGHSSGGWSTLWLQVAYPKMFGGSWPTAPDPSDFHNFTNVNIYAPGANAYVDAQGKPIPLVRDKGVVKANFRDFARMEEILGHDGGQLKSFDWVFSPKGETGDPLPMFDRVTGAVDPKVAAYWRDHYDIAHIVTRDWAKLKPDLDGKIHLTVGTADTFYLNESATLLKQAFEKLGAPQDINFVDGRTHFDLYKIGDDRMGFLKTIAWQMYEKARPGTKRP